jgi:hypothetical protein
MVEEIVAEMAEPIEIPKRPSDTDRLLHLALLLKAQDGMEQEKSEYLADWKTRREKLAGELGKLRYEILSGQERLPLTGD